MAVAAVAAARFKDYLVLSKHKLSALVVYTTGVGYVMRFPEHDNAHSSRQFQFWSGLVPTVVGTTLASASANALNQVYEAPRDALMSRTMRRPLAAGRISSRHGLAFALVTGSLGVAILDRYTNRLCAGLAATNIALYAAVYTPLKVISPINTWVGAIVGAIPPLIGWSSAGDLTSASQLMNWHDESGAIILASLLFLWQIPHFNALAMLCVKDYSAGGYRMLAQIDPRANANWGVLTSIAMLPLGLLAANQGLTGPEFTIEALALNGWITAAACRLAGSPTSVPAARNLFRSSITYLPVSLALMMVHKNRAPLDQPLVSSFRELDPEIERMRHLTYRHHASSLHAPYLFAPVPRIAPATVEPNSPR